MKSGKLNNRLTFSCKRQQMGHTICFAKIAHAHRVGRWFLVAPDLSKRADPVEIALKSPSEVTPE